jgi:hypothetical protein
MRDRVRVIVITGPIMIEIMVEPNDPIRIAADGLQAE